MYSFTSSRHAFPPSSKFIFQIRLIFRNRDWDHYYKKVDDNMDDITISVFLVLALTIFVVGCCLLLRIKSNYPKLHKQHGCIFWLALIALSVPLSMRSILDFSLDSWEPSTDGEAAAYNIIFFLFTDLLPIIF